MRTEKRASRRQPRVVLTGFFCAQGLLLLSLLWVTLDAHAAEVLVPTFGKGSTQVRLYTDYFCGPCSRMEPKIEALITDLVHKNSVTLTFIDTPVHSFTPLYAKFFLYSLKRERTFPLALKAREILFDAARNKIEGQESLEGFLKKNNLEYSEFDVKETLAALSAMIREDEVRSTPTCVIIKDGKKGVYTGDIEIPKALEALR